MLKEFTRAPTSEMTTSSLHMPDSHKGAAEANAMSVAEEREAAAEMAAPASSYSVPIRGANSDLPVRFAPEGAVPGDRIVGILQPVVGITIYPIQSSALTAYDDQPERWIDVRWDIDARAERELLKSPLGVPTRWLQAPHHGSKTSHHPIPTPPR